MKRNLYTLMIIFVFIIVCNTIVYSASDNIPIDNSDNFERLINYEIIDNLDYSSTISRFECIKALVSMVDASTYSKLDISYFDDIQSQEQGPYLAAAHFLGIAYGYQMDEKWLFEPNRDVTWGEMAAFVSRCIKIEPPQDFQKSFECLKDNGLIDENIDIDLNNCVDAKSYYKILNRLLDCKSCFSYKYCFNVDILDSGNEIYCLASSFREQQSETYDEVKKYILQTKSNQPTIGFIDEKISYKIFNDKNFILDEYLKVGNVEDTYKKETEYIMSDSLNINAIVNAYEQYISNLTNMHCIQVIHNPDTGVWVAKIEESSLIGDDKAQEKIIMVFNEQEKTQIIYSPFQAKY